MTTEQNKVEKTFDFTIYWKDEDEKARITEMLKAWTGDCTRLQVCQEVCPDTKKDHYQCKCTWRVGKRWTQMKKLMGHHHFEKSVSKCFAYTAKLDSTMIVTHDGRAPGARSDLVAMKAIIDNGGTEEDLWDEHFGSMCRYNNAMSKYKALKSKKRKRPLLDVEWIIGPSGAGKSTQAEKENPDAYWLNQDGTGNIWWDGYDGESCVVIDDFRPNMFTYEQLLKLLSSRGNYRIAHKGGSGWLTCEKIVLTSVEHPRNLYGMYDVQLERRVTRFVTVTEVTTR